MASGRVAYLNGAFVPETEAKITLFDSQNHMGDMVHENTRTFGHRPFKLREHMERLYYSMAAVEIDWRTQHRANGRGHAGAAAAERAHAGAG